MTHPDDCLLVCSPTSRTIEFFDVATGSTRKVIPDVIAQPHEVDWDRNRRRAYVTHPYRAGAYASIPKGHEISIVDVDNFEILAVIDIAPFFAPHDICVDSRGDVYVAEVTMSAGGNRGLERVRAKGRTQLLRPLQRGKPTPDEKLIPLRAILIEQQDGLPGRSYTRPGSRCLNFHQGDQPVNFGFLGNALGQNPPQTECILAQHRS